MSRDTKPNQVHGNQTNILGDAPTLNRGAQGVGGQPPSYEDAVKICETLTDKEIDMLLISNNPLGQICLDIEIIDEVIEEQSKADERIKEEIEASIRESLEAEREIEEEVRKSIEEADYEKERQRLDAWALAEVG